MVVLGFVAVTWMNAVVVVVVHDSLVRMDLL